MQNKKQSFALTAILLTVIAAVSKVIGFAREMVIASVYGAGIITHAYNMSSGFVATANLLVSTYLLTTFVPSYVRIRQEKGEDQAVGFTGQIFGLAITVNLFYF